MIFIFTVSAPDGFHRPPQQPNLVSYCIIRHPRRQRMEFQLRHAIFDGDLPTVRRILKQPAGGGVNVNAGINEDGWTALHFSVARGHLRIVQAILQVGGVNVNVRTVTGLTPLHMAHRLAGGIGCRSFKPCWMRGRTRM